MRGVFSIALVVLMFVGLLAGCRSGDNVSSDPDVSSAQVSKSLAVCSAAIQHPVQRIVQYGFIAGARDLGLDEPLVSGLTQGSVQEITERWKQDIGAHAIDGVLMFTDNDLYYGVMREWHDAGIKVVISHYQHSYAETREIVDANIAADRTVYGAAAADYVIEQLYIRGVSSGAIGISVNNADSAQAEAIQSFRRRVAEHNTGFTVVETCYEGEDPLAAVGKLEEYLRRYPDMVAGVGFVNTSAYSWNKAAQAAGRTELMVVGLDFTEVTLNYLDEGKIDALVARPLYESAYQGAGILNRLLEGAVYETEQEWFIGLDAPLIIPKGAGVSGVEHYRDLIKEVDAFFAGR